MELFNGLIILQKTKEIPIKKCLICKIEREFMATFYECSHSCCTTCLDQLYDNAKISENNELFTCIFCNNKIYNIKFI